MTHNNEQDFYLINEIIRNWDFEIRVITGGKNSLTKYKISWTWISVGNHTYNHYLLSSLTREKQISEILSNKKLIETIMLDKSNIFSISFGGEKDFNSDTTDILKDLGFKGALLSRNDCGVVINQEGFC